MHEVVVVIGAQQLGDYHAVPRRAAIAGCCTGDAGEQRAVGFVQAGRTGIGATAIIQRVEGHDIAVGQRYRCRGAGGVTGGGAGYGERHHAVGGGADGGNSDVFRVEQ